MLTDLTDSTPAFAKDLPANLALALGAPDLTPLQVWAAAYGAVLACKEPQAIAAIVAAASDHLDARTIDAVRETAVMMSANNYYWRFWYLVDDKEYLDIKPEFSETVMASHGGMEPTDFECVCIAVSAVNVCAGCLKVHSRKLLKLGFTKTQIMHVVRIAAAVHSYAVARAAA